MDDKIEISEKTLIALVIEEEEDDKLSVKLMSKAPSADVTIDMLKEAVNRFEQNHSDKPSNCQA